MSDTAEPACQDVQAHLLLHVGGDLEPTDAERVAAHLAHCPPCSLELRAARRARAALLALREEPGSGTAPADLWPGVRRALASEGALRARPGDTRPKGAAPAAGRDRARAPRSLDPILRWGIPAAAAAAIALTALFALRRDGDPGGAGAGVTPAPVAAGTFPEPPLGAGIRTPGGARVLPAGLRRIQPGEELLRDTAAVYPSGFQPAPPVAKSGGWPPDGGPRPRVAGDGELR